MRLTLTILALTLGAGASALASQPIDLAPLNYPPGALTSMLQARALHPSADCPASPGSCGVVGYKSGTYTTFGQGTCIKLGADVASMYVTKCYCSLWNTCEGGPGDVYVAGMMMCQPPETEFGKEVKYVSCGGMK